MLHKIVLLLVLTVASLYVGAQPVQVNPDHPDQYEVQKGDTLWDISARFLTEPWRWPEIWKTNPQIADPHLIYPGDIVTLSYNGNTPVLSVNRGGSVSGRNVKLSPEIRSDQRDRAIPGIPIDVIRQFLTRPLVIGESDMNNWPYIVSSYEQHLIAGPGIEIYVRGLDAASGVNKYSIYRKGPAYIQKSGDKETVLGYEAIYVGDAEVRAFGDPSTVIVTSAVKEVLNGDRLIARRDDEMYSEFVPSSPASPIDGNIISAQDVLSEIGQYQVVVLDKGANEGVSVGNVFGIYQSGRTVTDKIKSSGKKYNDSALVEYLGKSSAAGEPVTLPEVRAGVMMVFRVFDQVSYALVMEALRPVHLYDRAKSL
jgi:LysM domain